ncbi:CAI-1 autoinducer sensor kinase/phosphatase cqsS isoform 1 [Zea mays]|uniref:CAI-1 autoinducer sensor kinase/phosphatase cqsS isoform 1 n=1 Tax=Zea mays TaxID=4577 RepID=A0A1D6P2Y6_MAIZE|nr:CAI-1 autoinducer sensor kinase/phosphatase cqsS isoform 1 [Zea mays]AQL04363.1 CAI-1 autoinducer sensor kinase/phosphatase cqsS isoform 1 [Zea mays]AQL04368.1 CAI-1 autoinducer sensor kinase/phosphatase cqsS isoform 1 [Zea mays]
MTPRPRRPPTRTGSLPPLSPTRRRSSSGEFIYCSTLVLANVKTWR